MLPAAPFTLPAAGDAWLVDARARYLRQSLRRLLDWPDGAPAHVLAAYRAVREVLTEVFRANPADMLSSLSLPSIGAPLHAGALDVAVPNLLLELARRRLLPPEGVWWSAPVRALVNPPLGVGRQYDPALVGVLFLPGHVSIARHEEWALTGNNGDFLALRQGGWLALADANPLANVEGHPEKSGNGTSVGDTSCDTWVCRLDAARDIIAQSLPGLAGEHRQLLACINPVGTHDEQSFSASYRESIGQIYVSLHPDQVVMAEAIVHEMQHNKANLLSYTDPLLENANVLTSSPVRPDLRPLWGVLLAAHAFLPVEVMLRVRAQQHPTPSLESRLARIRLVNRAAMNTLRTEAVCTEVGKRLLSGLDALEVAMESAVSFMVD